MKYSPDFSSRFRILKGGKISLVVSALIASVTMLHAAPSGGVVTSGSANIAQNGSVTTITQSTNKAAINWQNFSIGTSETVNFNQPTVNAVTLNRVVGNEKSIIDGALNANGQVFILNSNGVLFSKNASINTAGLVATTMNLSDADFMNGNYAFRGESTASVINQGTINISDKGYATLFGKEVKNEGIIKATLGKVELAGAKEVTLNLNGNSLVNLKVDKGVLDALVENKGAIYADGGEVYLTTNAVNELLKGVVNNTGIIEANSLEDITGEVILFAHGGALHVNGTIEAEGGFVETSGKTLHVEDSTIIKTKKWLIDPDNITIESSGGAVGGDSVSATAIQNALSSSDIELQAINDITVNENITWATDKKLTLKAGDEIRVNATIENTNTTNGGVYFNARNTTDKVVFGTDGKVVIHNPYQLQWMNQALAGKYELGSDINLNVFTWAPIIASEVTDTGSPINPFRTVYYGFSGTFDGLGHTISNLTINDTTRDKVGLFGQTNGATIKNVGLVNVNITGKDYVGTLVGSNNDTSTIENAYATGSVSGASWVGGLVGENINSSTIKNSYAIVTVSATSKTAGGLAGLSFSNSPIINSYASGRVTGTTTNVGGLVGYYTGDYGGVTNSYYDNEANTVVTMGDTGFGKTKAELLALVTGGPWNNTIIWGANGSAIEGYASDTITLPFLRSVTKFDNTLFAGGYGTSANPYTITNWTQLQNINNNTNVLTHGYFFALSNNLNSTTTGYTNSGAGWLPIGNQTNQFIGNFNGANHTISDLFIHRLTTDYVGLFGHTNTGATIQNIGIVNANITGSSDVGGLVGKSNRTTIANAYATGRVSGLSFVGGLVGSSYQGSITNAYATSSVDGADMIGGLVGSNWQTDITNTYARGSVSGAGTNVGGLVGSSYQGSITASFWDTDTSGRPSSAGGVGKSTAELKKISTFENAGWNVGTGTSETPSLSMGGAYIWTMLPETVSYTLSDISNTYKGAAYTLSDLWNASTLFGASFSSWIAGTDYKFLDNNGNEIASYTNAGTYSNLHIDILRNGYNEASSGNTAGKFTITPKALTITGTTTANKVYDGSIASITTLGTLSGFIGTETVLASVVGTFADKNVATNITVTQSYTLADGINGGLASNYILANTTSQANITPASLTVIANNASKTYDGSVYNGGNGVSYSGFVNNETASVLNGSLSYVGTSQSATNVGSYVITPSGLSSGNYTLSYVDGALTITPKALSVTAESKTRTYGEVNPTLTYTTTGLVNGDSLSGTLSTTAGQFSNVGSYTITQGDLANSNYTLNFTNGNLEVTKRAITLSATNSSKVYGETNPTLAYTIANGTVVNSDSLGVNLSTTATQFSNVGSYTIVNDGTLNANYDVTFHNGVLTITPKALSVTGLVANDKTYDGTTSVTISQWGSLVGLVGTETLTLGHGTASFDTADVGDGKIVTAIGYTLSDGTNGGVAGNYLLIANTATTTANITTPPTQDLTPIITQIINGTAITPPVIPSFAPPPPVQAPQQFNVGGTRVQLASVPSGDSPSQLVGTQEARAMIQGEEVGDLRIPLGQNSRIQLVNGGVRLPDGLEQQFFMAQR